MEREELTQNDVEWSIDPEAPVEEQIRVLDDALRQIWYRVREMSILVENHDAIVFGNENERS